MRLSVRVLRGPPKCYCLFLSLFIWQHWYHFKALGLLSSRVRYEVDTMFSVWVMIEKLKLDDFFCIWHRQSWKKRFGTLLHTIPIHSIITSVVKWWQISCNKWNVMYNRYDLTSPLPPQSMLGHFGKLMMALVCSTLKRGRGGVILLLFARNRSKSYNWWKSEVEKNWLVIYANHVQEILVFWIKLNFSYLNIQCISYIVQ